MTGDIMKRGLSHKKYLVYLVKPCISANSLQKENNSIVVNYKVMPCGEELNTSALRFVTLVLV